MYTSRILILHYKVSHTSTPIKSASGIGDINFTDFDENLVLTAKITPLSLRPLFAL